jgi:hypothetical protein
MPLSRPRRQDPPILLTHHDVMARCAVNRDKAFELMHSAGAIRLGRSLRVLERDLVTYLTTLRQPGQVA